MKTVWPAPMLLAAAILAAGCASAPEDPLLRQYFRASHLRENGALGNIALVSLDPVKDGAVTDFSITTVSPSRIEPLKIEMRPVARLSLARLPEMPDLSAVDAELVSEDVAIDATLKMPDGSTARKTLVVTLQRVKAGGATGIWIVTGVKTA